MARVKDILQMDWKSIASMTRQELAKTVSSLASAANKRLRRFESAGEYSSVYHTAMEKGDFSVKGKNINQLRSEFVRAKDFLESQTGSLKQWRAVKADTIKSVEYETGVQIEMQDFEDFIKIYGEAAREFEDARRQSNSTSMIAQAYQKYKEGQTEDQIKDFVRGAYISAAEKAERENAEFDRGGVSGFYGNA